MPSKNQTARRNELLILKLEKLIERVREEQPTWHRIDRNDTEPNVSYTVSVWFGNSESSS